MAKNGSDSETGSVNHPLLTINRAAAIARPGDIITVHQGIYREWVKPLSGGSSANKRIIYQAAKGETVVISGAETVSGWRKLDGHVWRLVLSNQFFGSYNPFGDLIRGDWYFGNMQLPAPLDLPKFHGHELHTGEVYHNGMPLHEASLEEVMEDVNVGDPFGKALQALSGQYTWHAEVLRDSTVITANFQDNDPNHALTEVNVRPSCFYPERPGIDFITVRGFRIRQAATQWAAPTAEQVGAIGTHWSKCWIIENNLISESKCAGITLGKDRATGHNEWSDDMNADGSVIYNRVVERAIAAGWNKEHIGSHLVRHNEIYNCGTAGICGSLGAIFSTIAGNDIHDIYTNRRFWGAEMGGIKLHGAIDVVISDNLVRNTNIGIWLDWMAQGTTILRNYCSENDYVDLFMEVNHGPYRVTGNSFMSRFSLKDWSENGTFQGNTFAGILSFAPQDRKTPFFKPHSTVLLGTRPISSGNNHFDNNQFLSKASEVFVPLPGAVIPWDGVDKLSGYRPLAIK
ncbi:right-handed parallel beta-helix repeat-containing protein [Mucilaginibacter sp. CAU 1740]|uniref:right-handed parallel beta-helix repeat-containing protein n=1 Tax=Mucilaginibacter sp. CAU 1740 TaxID=3140365 RepID=UPI00325C1068